MGENSAIEWTTHTFNPWVGCTKVSPGCDHCYAEGWAKRSGLVTWGGDRRRTSPANWRKPLQWNAEAAKSNTRPRVFCASLADVFDNAVDREWRRDLFSMIAKTKNLDWLLLTKRIGNAAEMLEEISVTTPALDPLWWPNVWLGITVVNQDEADRDIPKLLRVPAAVRFLSCEPLLGPISFEGRWVDHRDPAMHENWLEALSWVIVGGESGSHARPMNATWAYDLRDQCTAVGTPFFFKQWGEYKHVGYTSGAAGDDEGEGWIFDAPDHRMRPYMWKCGKKKAGRVLDNRTWDEFPRSSHTFTTNEANTNK